MHVYSGFDPRGGDSEIGFEQFLKLALWLAVVSLLVV